MFDGVVTVGGEVVTAQRDEVWTELHRTLKKLGVRRAVLDAKELDLLREAEEMGLYWRRGHATMAAYMVRSSNARGTRRTRSCGWRWN